MVFVPMVPPQRPPSARALDLGRRLKAEVEKFEAQYPGTSREDLRAAASLAIGEQSVYIPARRRVAAAIVGMLAALGVAVPMLTSAVERKLPIWPIAAFLFAIGVATVVSVAARRRRQE